MCIRDRYTLKLIVQPILENAIYHGMSAAEDEGVISVRAYRRGDDLFIDVEDNGLGMRPEEMCIRDRPWPAPQDPGSRRRRSSL